jgi:hypothetical protein
MKSMRITAGILVLGALASGCSSNSLREGTWKLSFEALDSRTGESMDKYFESAGVAYHHVDLKIEWAKESEDEVVEIKGVRSYSALGTSARDQTGLPPMYGSIPLGKNEIIIRGRDDSFQFYLVGKVLSEEHIDGKNFLAKSHLEDEAVEGRWKMKWISD